MQWKIYLVKFWQVDNLEVDIVRMDIMGACILVLISKTSVHSSKYRYSIG